MQIVLLGEEAQNQDSYQAECRRERTGNDVAKEKNFTHRGEGEEGNYKKLFQSSEQAY